MVDTLIIFAGIGLGVLIVASGLLTVGLSVSRYRTQRRADEIRDELRSGLLSRLYGNGDPQWEDWVEQLSQRERTVVESLLETYLRTVEGSDATKLASLGDALGVTERAHSKLTTGGYYDRLDALTWFALLRHPPAITDLREHCMGTPRERAAAVRVLYLSDHPEANELGVELLLDDNDAPFSVFGLDTLYRVAAMNPAPLFALAATDFEQWSPPLQQQVLLACRHLRTVVGDADLSWLASAIESPEERTRSEAIRTLGGFSWHETLRSDINLEDIVADPSPAVRKSGYEMLQDWGDERAISVLQYTGMVDPDERARVAAARGLFPYRERYDLTIPDAFSAAWSWAAAEDTYDRLAKDIDSKPAVDTADTVEG